MSFVLRKATVAGTGQNVEANNVICRTLRADSIESSVTGDITGNITGDVTSNVVTLNEGTQPEAPEDGQGQLWVSNSTPNTLQFTDDANATQTLGTFISAFTANAPGELSGSINLTDLTESHGQIVRQGDSVMVSGQCVVVPTAPGAIKLLIYAPVSPGLDFDTTTHSAYGAGTLTDVVTQIPSSINPFIGSEGGNDFISLGGAAATTNPHIFTFILHYVIRT